MPALSRDLRKKLEKLSADARTAAEAGAEKALHALAVGEREAHRSMTPQQKVLRNKLRAHGRQLGDKQNLEKGTQELDRLITECAYEHWHRMLFARFLAANNVLIEPVSGEAISLDEVRELAHSRGRDWVALAGEFAVKMLPQVFRQNDPVLDVQFAPEDRKALENLLQALPEDVFLASDSLGWCYQFWQAEKKDEVNAAGEKIGADELSAVTQLFTEDYMVDFLLDNTLGAWHAGKVLRANPKIAETAQNEGELRRATKLPGCPWAFLRFVKESDGRWSPAAGTFDGWPLDACDLKALDPCMGSGHFVVAMFERLVALRLAEEDLDDASAVAAVIRDNLFGLELDPRCTQLGAFSLALAAWRRVGHRQLPAMNLACSGLAPNAREGDWRAIAGEQERLKSGMARLYRLFKDAPVLGSLINPRNTEGDLLEAGFVELQPVLEKALALETTDDLTYEMAVTARGLAKAAQILAGQFTLVATNVPYLGRGKQEEVLQDYCRHAHPDAKADLATCFVERCIGICASGGTTALVTPQNWLFLTSYRKFRETLLRDKSWNAVARLGSRAFETIGGEVVNVGLLAISNSKPVDAHGFLAVDVAEEKTPFDKTNGLLEKAVLWMKQKAQLRNPEGKLMLMEAESAALLNVRASSYQGIKTGDDERVRRCFWELSAIGSGWRFFQSTVETTRMSGGLEGIIDWRDNGDGLARRQGLAAWGKNGVMVSQMSDMPVALYYGEPFDSNASPIVSKNPSDIPALWEYCASPGYRIEVRKVDQSLKPTNTSLVQVPFDLEHWQKEAAQRYPDGLPKPFSSDPTQWLFSGHPRGSDQPLHVAVARLLGYQWPRQTGSNHSDCAGLSADGLEKLADDDGIVPISSAKGEGPAAERLRELLARAYGKEWNAARQETLLAQADYSDASLDDWLRNGFFEQHCTLFNNRPFVWHVWDGLGEGFHALINYHSLASSGAKGRQTLEKLTFSYLGDWITRQKAEQKAGNEGADAKIAAALYLQDQLKLILEGEPPYDLFVRWKPLHEQAIGWQPDVNDGVRMNIRPFMMAKTLYGKSIFRKTPKIKWDKDRGKEPERPKKDFPWFWGWDEKSKDFMGGRAFDGNRWNDLHYSCDVKQDARTRQKEKKR